MSEEIQKLKEWCTRQDQTRLRDNEQRSQELNATNIHIVKLQKENENLIQWTKNASVRFKTLEDARQRQRELNSDVSAELNDLFSKPKSEPSFWDRIFK